MANASRRSKQKQQTSKKESQASSEPATNGQTQPLEGRVYLSVQQAALAKQLLAASNEAQNQVQFFLAAAGISGQDVIGGDLDSEKPYFLVKDPE